jgi:hypothetical protein
MRIVYLTVNALCVTKGLIIITTLPFLRAITIYELAKQKSSDAMYIG